MFQGYCYTGTSQVIKNRESCFYVLKNKINAINTVNRDKNFTLKCLARLKKQSEVKWKPDFPSAQGAGVAIVKVGV